MGKSVKSDTKAGSVTHSCSLTKYLFLSNTEVHSLLVLSVEFPIPVALDLGAENAVPAGPQLGFWSPRDDEG